jgi:hypothetical protein
MRPMQVFSICVVLVLGGCGLFSSKSGGPLIADARSPIVDVPVPAGFSMSDESSSKVIPASGLRMVNHRYTGHDDLLPIVDFYKQLLPTKGWVLADQSQQPGQEVSLHYTKKSEECSVTISERTFDTVIRVKIDPLPR